MRRSSVPFTRKGSGETRPFIHWPQATPSVRRTPTRSGTASGRLSYRDLVAAADALACDLQSNGVKPGQRVAVWLPSRIEGAVALLACSRNGYVCCPSLHRDHTVADIVGLLRRMSACALIVEPGYGAGRRSRRYSDGG